jgi:hypothetical protein
VALAGHPTAAPAQVREAHAAGIRRFVSRLVSRGGYALLVARNEVERLARIRMQVTGEPLEQALAALRGRKADPSGADEPADSGHIAPSGPDEGIGAAARTTQPDHTEGDDTADPGANGGRILRIVT